MNDDDRRRLAEIASKVRRGVRHPEIAAACEGVLAMAAERNVTGSIERNVTVRKSGDWCHPVTLRNVATGAHPVRHERERDRDNESATPLE